MDTSETVLVTGATGFIGSHLVRFLVDRGVPTVCLVRPAKRSSEVMARLKGAQLLPIHRYDQAGMRQALSEISAPRVVFHLASPGVLQGKDEPYDVIKTNVQLVTDLLMVASEWPLRRFIYTGSSLEYGYSDQCLSEDSPLLPASVYGASKAAAYLSGRTLAAHLGIPFVNLRLFGVYGPGEASVRLIPFLIDRLSKQQPAELTGGEQVRDLLYVEDVVRALWAASQCTRLSDDDTYNVCSGNGLRVREIGEFIARQLNAPDALLNWGARAYRSDESMSIVGNNNRFVTWTRWQPQTTLEEGIAHMLAAKNADRKMTGSSMPMDVNQLQPGL